MMGTKTTSASCVPCENGFSTGYNNGFNNCTKCQDDGCKLCPGPGYGVCTSCSYGYYMNETNKTCIKCGVGQTTATPGSTSDEQCGCKN